MNFFDNNNNNNNNDSADIIGLNEFILNINVIINLSDTLVLNPEDIHLIFKIYAENYFIGVTYSVFLEFIMPYNR